MPRPPYQPMTPDEVDQLLARCLLVLARRGEAILREQQAAHETTATGDVIKTAEEDEGHVRSKLDV